MKRFFCTVCQKMKRVRRMPDNVETPNAPDPGNRIGQCSRHSSVTYRTRPISRKVSA